ncbi:ribose-phosphate pyrophosphokinase 1 [Gossypium hirsutum]|uniref:ribose-phosphate diphosphokinase n=1 Tax=Gossypium hirsutum TaxID=3635 RepID=A0A1U8JK40_GOSHI|nr:ribose-phosphate pyrophosphokinase 1-like [Gossypium hirsutum]
MDAANRLSTIVAEMGQLQYEIQEHRRVLNFLLRSVRTIAAKDRRCSLVEPLKFENGKPHFPLLASDPAFPTFLSPNSHFQNDINKHDTRLRIFSGTANPALAQEIACYMGLELGKTKIKRFADGEIYVQLQESVRGCDVFLVQPTCPPANENLMELLIIIDACRRASAKNITALIPYFGYARADRKTQGRESIAAKLVANLITEAGANRVLACDLHSGQSMGYFDIPVDHVYGQPIGGLSCALSCPFFSQVSK